MRQGILYMCVYENQKWFLNSIEIVNKTRTKREEEKEREKESPTKELVKHENFLLGQHKVYHRWS